MFLELLQMFGNMLLFFILHVTGSGAFPRPLSPQEEKECLLLAKEGDKSARNKPVSYTHLRAHET